MNLITKRKLGARIIAYLLLVVVLFGLLMVFYIRRNTGHRYDSELSLYTIHGQTLIRNFGDNIIFGLLSRDVEILDREMDKLFTDPTMSYAAIYDETGKSVYDHFGEGVDKNGLPLGTSLEPGSTASVSVRTVVSRQGEPFLDLLMMVKSPGKESSAMGYVRLGMSLANLDRQIRNMWVEGLALVGGILAVCLVMVLIILRSVMPPINRLAEAARKIGTGDLDLQVEVTSEDEIGLLTDTFNEMVRSIASQTRRAAAMIANIGEAISLLTETTTHLLTVSSEQASGATEQAATVEEVVATTEEIATTSTRIAETADSVNQAAQKTSEACYQGNEYMESSILGMEEIRKQVAKVTDQVMALAQQAQMIGGVIDIIEEISEQTNLLALNAAIEAAGAGEAGKRFSVVASEVRHLANRTLEATESVRRMVDSIQKSTSSMVMLAEDEQKAVTTGVDSVRRMGEYFRHILEMVETTRKASSEIGLITRQQSTASQQMVTSIQEVEEVAKEVEKGAKEIETSMAELKLLADRLRSVITEKEAREGAETGLHLPAETRELEEPEPS